MEKFGFDSEKGKNEMIHENFLKELEEKEKKGYKIEFQGMKTVTFTNDLLGSVHGKNIKNVPAKKYVVIMEQPGQSDPEHRKFIYLGDSQEEAENPETRKLFYDDDSCMKGDELRILARTEEDFNNNVGKLNMVRDKLGI